jgi:hypothetical protein
MQSLVQKAKKAHASARPSIAVSPSIPILYFGDCDAFRRSKTRILTVGLNPSLREFPSDDPFLRFPAYKSSYQTALNRYFHNCPYRKWFSTFDHLLEGFDASFYGNGEKKNTALHTDLLTPVATRETWSKLPKSERQLLQGDGIPLWHDLIANLKPHILLISIADRHRTDIQFHPIQDWRRVLSVTSKKDGEPRQEPYHLLHSVVRISEDFSADVLFGRAAQTPFGALSNDDKKKIGKRLKNRLTNW